MEDFEELDLHKPKSTDAALTSKLFETHSEKVRVILRKLHLRNY